ncbi:RNA 2',3'-cyclic phosphodiesterase [Chlamydiota bacterium]
MKKDTIDLIRSFIAIELLSSTQNLLTDIRKKVEDRQNIIKWAKPESIHLTLKFLGAVSQKQIDKVEEKLTEVAGSVKQFRFTIKGIGVFENFRFPRIIWVEIDEGKEEIMSLAHSIETACHLLGFKKEKRAFIPHITIARIKKIQNKETFKENVLCLRETFFAQEKVTMLSLMKSDLTPIGAVHTPIKHCMLLP